MNTKQAIESLYAIYLEANDSDGDRYEGDFPPSAAYAVCNPISRALGALGVDMDKTCGTGEIVMVGERSWIC